MSFLGPKTADAAYRTGYDAVLSALGYRLRVTEAAWRRVPGGTELTVTLANEGSAPFYWDWPVNLYAETAEGTTLETVPLGISLPELLPGQTRTAKVKLTALSAPFWEERDRRVTMGIVDPMTGRDASASRCRRRRKTAALSSLRGSEHKKA